MSRLTKKDKNGYEVKGDNPNTSIAMYISMGIQKLGQLEDIEEELGIDLITLFKALKQNMWYKHYDKEYNETWIWDAHCYMKPLLNVYSKTIEIKEYVDNAGGYWYVDKDVVYLKDYGKTWALTKEELQ